MVQRYKNAGPSAPCSLTFHMMVAYKDTVRKVRRGGTPCSLLGYCSDHRSHDLKFIFQTSRLCTCGTHQCFCFLVCLPLQLGVSPSSIWDILETDIWSFVYFTPLKFNVSGFHLTYNCLLFSAALPCFATPPPPHTAVH
jgi:hypothetical protein